MSEKGSFSSAFSRAYDVGDSGEEVVVVRCVQRGFSVRAMRELKECKAARAEAEAAAGAGAG